MKDKEYKFNWIEVYAILAESLYQFEKIHGKESSRRLYELCEASQQFITENSWFGKFLHYEHLSALDPIHVFASVSANNMEHSKRVRKIKILLSILSESIGHQASIYQTPVGSLYDLNSITLIDFSGCPAPPQIHSLSLRDEERQEEIWFSLSDIYENKQNCKLPTYFSQLKSWYGVSVKLFTMFLFWLQPKHFIPLDRNTLSLLQKYDVISRTINKPSDYKDLLKRRNTNLYINIALVSYSNDRFKELPLSEQDQFNDYFKRSADNKNSIPSTSFFELIAIKPLEGCSKKLSKSLKNGQIYKLLNNYNFENENDKKIIHTPNFRLYDQDRFSLTISAIVGKNGTGKSTIAELFIAAFNNVAYKAFLNNPDKEPSNHRLMWANKLKVEFYYSTDTLYKVSINDEDIKVTQYDEKNGVYSQSKEIQGPLSDLNKLFYTTLINYSLHGLNTLDYGDWLFPVFHKSDGYQTPAVIEPYRLNGVIDVNRQDDLSKQRLVSNLLMPDNNDEDSFRVLKKGEKTEYRAAFMKLKCNFKKLCSNDYRKIDKKLKLDILSHVLEGFEAKEQFNRYYNEDKWFCIRTSKYIVKKTLKILMTYPEHFPFLQVDKTYTVNNIKGFVKALRKDDSHRTAKLRQAINCIKFDLYSRNSWGNINIQNCSELIEQILTETSAIETKKLDEEKHDFLVPPSFLETNIYINEDIEFSQLSSGEKQIILNINSILYHLRNVDGVVDSEVHFKYSYFNAFLDEIELYLHPEHQRVFLERLRRMINRFADDSTSINGVNLCFITHSPFVLSDITEDSILLLKHAPENELESIPVISSSKTFGANIHDLLNNGFFVKSTLGKFSESCIRDIVNLYQRGLNAKKDNSNEELIEIESNYKRDRNRFHFIADKLGDLPIQSIVRSHLRELDEITNIDQATTLDEQIKLKEEELIKLRDERDSYAKN